jgi:hypothetical protein
MQELDELISNLRGKGGQSPRVLGTRQSTTVQISNLLIDDLAKIAQLMDKATIR